MLSRCCRIYSSRQVASRLILTSLVFLTLLIGASVFFDFCPIGFVLPLAIRIFVLSLVSFFAIDLLLAFISRERWHIIMISFAPGLNTF